MKKIVIFGDSIAAGTFEGVTTEKLDHYVVDTLAGMGFAGYEVVNLGERGDSSAQSLARVEEAVAEQPDFFVLIVGANDAINDKGLTAYGENIKQMVAKFPAEKVFLYSPSFVDATRKVEASPDIIKTYVTEAKRVGEEMGVHTTNLYHYFDVYPEPGEFLQTDGVHPSEFGYHFLGALIARDIKNKLLAQ